MKNSFKKAVAFQRFASTFAIALAVICGSSSTSWSQEEEAGEKAEVASEDALATDSPAEAEEAAQAEEKDPFEIPKDASVDELFKYMDGLMRIRPDRSKPNGMAETAKKIFPTIIKAADIVLEKTDNDKERVQAISRQFQAYGILQRFDRSVAGAAKELAEKYSSSDNDGIAAQAISFLMNEKSSRLRTASLEEAEEVAQEALQFVKRFGPTRESYSATTGIARSIGYSEHTEVAADLYEQLSTLFAESEDEQISQRAGAMLGSARRMRLMGNSMEVFGTTAAGEEFDWDSYKGKVVLVDFWASWCGPCIGELPNMKKNLAAYGGKGFEIVGINMDSTRKAFEKCVEDKEITWVNIVSEDKVGWEAPMAQHYGITGIPTAILVDQKGKVVSLRARGGELDKQLQELLGDPEPEEPAEDSASPKALGTID